MDELPFSETESTSVTSPYTAGEAVRVRMLLAYDGGPYHGIASQPGHHTVGGQVSAALTQILRAPEPLRLVVAGRTDTGVHAWGQVVHVDIPATADRSKLGDFAKIRRSLAGMLGPTIVIRAMDLAPPHFHARYSAQWRRYRYKVLNELTSDPACARTAWHVAEPLDLDAMRLAIDPFLGEHDFTAFGRVPRHGRVVSMRRKVLAAGWQPHGDPDHPRLLRFEIRATSFCHQMVRAIVGFLVEVGRGTRHAGEILTLLRERKRPLSALAPARGLTLWEVGYPAPLAIPQP